MTSQVIRRISDGDHSRVRVRPVEHRTAEKLDGTGQPIDDVTLSVGQTLTLYAAGYDTEDNFAGNAVVDWSTTGTLSGLSTDSLGAYVVTLTPSATGNGTVITSNSNGWTNDR